jgi:transcriptional regulator with XRE-family HTH domain
LLDHGSPNVRGRRLAAELRRLRVSSGMTGEDVARALSWSESKISRIERHRTGVKEPDLRRLLDLYQVAEPRRGELLALARESTERSRRDPLAASLTLELSEYVEAEAEAQLIWNWEPQVIPGLLQTEDYAWAVVAGVQAVISMSPGDIDRRVRARMARQELIDRDPPVELAFVIDESVLRRKHGSNSVMRKQLRQLMERSHQPHVKVRILSLEGEHQFVTGSFTYMEFRQVHETPLADAVIVEQLLTNFRIDDEDDTFQYRRTFEHLVNTALSATKSRDLIRRTIGELWTK